jgi:3-oxoadipate enol-lactonase
MNPSQKNLELKLNDTTICYNETNRGKGNPVIFIHGFPFNKNMWNSQIDALLYHHCIAYDIRGFGNSTAGSDEFSIDLFADDLDDIMNLLETESAVICGLSMGGYIALRAAVKYPHRIKGLILWDTQCIADTPEGREKRYKVIEQIEASGLNAYAEASVKNLFCEKSFADNNPNIDVIKHMILNSSPSSVIATLKALANRSETCSYLSDINVPTLILCGREDKITPPAQAEVLHSGMKGSSLKIIEDAAHVSNLEQPALFNEAIGEFLKTSLS